MCNEAPVVVYVFVIMKIVYVIDGPNAVMQHEVVIHFLSTNLASDCILILPTLSAFFFSSVSLTRCADN